MKRTLGLLAAALIALSACDRSPPLANPVESKNGVSYIPIDDTAFLIPEKTWLKGYSRKSTDGHIGSITLHATIPDVQPWSQERHEEMYWKAGPGKKLDIYLNGDRAGQVERFYDVPQSIFSVSISSMVEEPTDQAAQGLRRYRQILAPIDEAEAEKFVASFGREELDRRRTNTGKLLMHAVYYELLEDNRMKYFIRCTEGSPGLFEGCHLYFPVSKTVMAEVHFVADHLKHVVSMADKLSTKLQEFQTAGRAYQAAKPSNADQSK